MRDQDPARPHVPDGSKSMTRYAESVARHNARQRSPRSGNVVT